MLKCLLMCSFLLVLSDGLSLAKIYRCEDAQGGIVYTDDLTKVPRGCDTEQETALPQLNVMPTPDTQPAKPRTKALPPAQPESSVQQDVDGRSYSALNGKAVSLVEQFDATRRAVVHSVLFKDRQKAKIELREIRSQKNDLLSEVENSPLDRSQKKKITERLSSITEAD